RVGQCMNPADEEVALIRRRLAEGLRRHRLHGAERVLHTMLDFVDEMFLHALQLTAFADVARDLGGADDLALAVLHGGYGQRKIDKASVLAPAHGFVMLDALAFADARDDFRLFAETILRD